MDFKIIQNVTNFDLQVNSRDGWDDLLETFDLPLSTSNGSLSLKQTYLR